MDDDLRHSMLTINKLFCMQKETGTVAPRTRRCAVSGRVDNSNQAL